MVGFPFSFSFLPFFFFSKGGAWQERQVGILLLLSPLFATSILCFYYRALWGAMGLVSAMQREGWSSQEGGECAMKLGGASGVLAGFALYCILES